MNSVIKNPTVMIFMVVFYIFTIVTSAQNTVHIEETTTELCGNGTEDSCEAFNNTELPTISAAVEVTSEITTSLPSKKPTSTTVKPVTKKPPSAPNSTTPTNPHPDCTCDVTRGDCEINCCCDVDCSSEQHAVFTYCLSVPQTINSDYCLSPQLLYRNNTDYQTLETEPGVLCVVHQNTLTSTDFLDVPVIRSETALQKKLGRHRYYSWPNPSPSLPVFDIDTSYGTDSPIWIFDNFTITPLVLPAPIGYSTVCRSLVMPQYIKEIETSCTIPLRTKSDCLQAIEVHFSVISSPHNFNFTQPQGCTDDICLSVQQYTCSESCTKEITPHPTFNDSSGTCQNLIESTKYKIYHNGSQGIIDVKAFHILKNISVHNNQLFRKHYKVSYVWAGNTEELVFRRSGWPGYKSGKPIISGRKTLKTVVFNYSKSDWISVGVSGSLGYCQTRQNLLFGENLRTQCLLPVNGTCKQIQQQIWQQLLGPAANLSEVMISSYGDPRMGEEEAWVPLLTGEPPPSPALTSAVDIIIVYSLIGSAALPQTKIIAAYLNLVPNGLTCDSNYTTVVIETSVKFIDKTTPAVTKFAQPPVYEIKLPRDFFYPFLSTCNRINFTRECICLVIILFVLN